MSTFEIISLIVALLSAVISFYTYARMVRLAQIQVRQQAEQIRLDSVVADLAKRQIEQLELESAFKKKAKIVVKVQQRPTHAIVLLNEGQGQATAVSLTIDGGDVLGENDIRPYLPADLHGGEHVSIPFYPNFDTDQRFPVTVHWTNEDQTADSKCTIVNVE